MAVNDSKQQQWHTCVGCVATRKQLVYTLVHGLNFASGGCTLWLVMQGYASGN